VELLLDCDRPIVEVSQKRDYLLDLPEASRAMAKSPDSSQEGPALARRLKVLDLLRRPLAQSETFIGKICGDDESDPANPDTHRKVPDRHVPPAGEADGVKQSYQREKALR